MKIKNEYKENKNLQKEKEKYIKEHEIREIENLRNENKMLKKEKDKLRKKRKFEGKIR